MQLGVPVEITKCAIGDQPWAGGNPEAVSGLFHEIAQMTIRTAVDSIQSGGELKLLLALQNLAELYPGLTEFLYAELGIFAKNPDGGDDVLIIYANAGTIYLSENSNIATVQHWLYIEFAPTTQVLVGISDPVNLTQEEAQLLITAHNADQNAHGDLLQSVIATHNADQNAHKKHFNDQSNPHQVTIQQAIAAAGANAIFFKCYTYGDYSAGSDYSYYTVFPIAADATKAFVVGGGRCDNIGQGVDSIRVASCGKNFLTLDVSATLINGGTGETVSASVTYTPDNKNPWINISESGITNDRDATFTFTGVVQL
jgi:hypothetical protein